MGCLQNKSEVSITSKYFLFFLNFIFTVVGILCTGLGAYVLQQKHKVVDDVVDFIMDPASILCLAGSITLVLSLAGCMGALRENICLLKFYQYSLDVLFLGQLVLVTFAFIFYYVPDAKTELNLLPEDALRQAIISYRDDEDTQDLIDDIQTTLECCGLSDSDEGYKDWNSNMYFNCSRKNKSQESCSVPYSCCRTQPGQPINFMCGKGALKYNDDDGLLKDPLSINSVTSMPDIYQRGCLKALGDWISKHSLTIGGVMLGILLPQLFLICTASNLAQQIKLQRLKYNARKRSATK